MIKQSQIDQMINQGRTISKANAGDPDLGPFAHLPGTWRSLPGRGWNMIALPFADGPFNYRLLLNQYNEDLIFTEVDKGVPNRGIDKLDGNTIPADQLLVALDYQQIVTQIAAEDSPVSGLAGSPGAAIHHEPGLFLHMTNETLDGPNIARLATIPHGNSVLALGEVNLADGAPTIPDIRGLPIGIPDDLDNKYLEPYKQFHEKLFEGLFDPTIPNELLKLGNEGVEITRTTTLDFNTNLKSGGISNIPFVVRQADATEMQSTFWIQELAELDAEGNPKLRMQYSQTVMLDFFPQPSGNRRIRWPHVSINTLEKIT